MNFRYDMNLVHNQLKLYYDNFALAQGQKGTTIGLPAPSSPPPPSPCIGTTSACVRGGGRGGGEKTMDWTGNEARKGEGCTERVI
jgi:hypothetical protein